MAKQTEGFLGGFNGRLGNAVGYRWKGLWCVRTIPGTVRNPRTEKQMEHREMFKEEVRQASRMAQAVNLGLRSLADEANMTAHNLFVSINQQAFSLVDGVFTVDYTTLRLSTGPAVPVAFDEPQVKEGNCLNVSFEKNPLRLTAANNFDYVYLYAYCPDLETGFMSAPVHRRDRHVAAMLPDIFAGHELQLYGMVQNQQSQMSETIYIGSVMMVEDTKSEISENSEQFENPENSEYSDYSEDSDNKEPSPATSTSQPTLFDIGDW